MSSRLHAAFAAAALVLAFLPAGAARSPLAADDVLQRSREMYADLKSYADTGTVVHEYGADSVDRHTFVTRFNRVPRHFYLEFNNQGGDRFVIWGDPDAFHTWWKTTGDEYDYPNPNNLPAINQSGRPTGSTANKIPTLLYAKAPLLSDFANFSDAVVDGQESIAGHRCHRVLGTTRDVYGATGKEVNIRKMTLWIDAESLLIRKVLEEWQAMPGQRSRTITTYEPQPNGVIAEAQFKFSPPTR
jgi:outer membrane lipoprotein-sorting protein